MMEGGVLMPPPPVTDGSKKPMPNRVNRDAAEDEVLPFWPCMEQENLLRSFEISNTFKAFSRVSLEEMSKFCEGTLEPGDGRGRLTINPLLNCLVLHFDNNVCPA